MWSEILSMLQSKSIDLFIPGRNKAVTPIKDAAIKQGSGLPFSILLCHNYPNNSSLL
jgi:hypothetical protein